MRHTNTQYHGRESTVHFMVIQQLFICGHIHCYRMYTWHWGIRKSFKRPWNLSWILKIGPNRYVWTWRTCGRMASRETEDRTKAQGWSRSGSRECCSHRSKVPGELWLEKTQQTRVEVRLWRLRDVGFIQETGERPMHSILRNDTTYFPFHMFYSFQTEWKVNFACSFTPYWLDHRLGSGHWL